jgi:hypothetical protein
VREQVRVPFEARANGADALKLRNLKEPFQAGSVQIIIRADADDLDGVPPLGQAALDPAELGGKRDVLLHMLGLFIGTDDRDGPAG